MNWTEKKTNDEVPTMVVTKRILIENIVRRKKNWIGHILRGNGLVLEVMEGRMEGKHGTGRLGMLDELMDEISYENMKRKAQNRAEWRDWLPWTCRKAEHE